MKLQIFTVDAFSSKTFGGNPAAVCILQNDLPEDLYSKIAMEMNLSETAFIVPVAETKNLFKLRWFTPTVEVNLCGHATLASAHVIFSKNVFPSNLDSDTITFQTLSGELIVTKQDTPEYKLMMNFPSGNPKILEDTDFYEELTQNLGITKDTVEKTSFCEITKKLLVQVDNFQTVLKANPNFPLLIKTKLPVPARGIIVTTGNTIGYDSPNSYDFISRYFAPYVGINEDPVTGSAHTVLAVHWNSQLKKSEFLALQASSRGGILKLSLKGDRIEICGDAVVVLEGTFEVEN